MIKKEKIDKPKISTTDKKKKEDDNEIKEKIRERWRMPNILWKRRRRHRGRGEGGKGSHEYDKKNAEVVGHAVIETYIRKGLEAQKEKNKGDTYTIKDCTILDVSWGQCTELRPGENWEKRKQVKHSRK